MLKVKKFSKDLPDLKMIDKGDWIDLYVNSGAVAHNSLRDITDQEDNRAELDVVSYKAGDVVIIGLGMALELPTNNEAEMRPRSSIFKNTGLLLTNSVGTIDESYCGDNDEWKAMFYATRDGHVKRLDRLLQFRISNKMLKLPVMYVDKLHNEDRGGYGTTGKGDYNAN